MNTDILFIEKLMVMASIGIYDWEKKCLQKLIFDLQLGYNAKFVLYSKSIVCCIDYTNISRVIFNLMNKQHFYLVENVANVVADILIKKFDVCWIRIKVSKPGAIYDAANVGVCIERKKQSVI